MNKPHYSPVPWLICISIFVVIAMLAWRYVPSMGIRIMPLGLRYDSNSDSIETARTNLVTNSSTKAVVSHVQTPSGRYELPFGDIPLQLI